jgi:hypothetical protein
VENEAEWGGEDGSNGGSSKEDATELERDEEEKVENEFDDVEGCKSEAKDPSSWPVQKRS